MRRSLFATLFLLAAALVPSAGHAQSSDISVSVVVNKSLTAPTAAELGARVDGGRLEISRGGVDRRDVIVFTASAARRETVARPAPTAGSATATAAPTPAPAVRYYVATHS